METFLRDKLKELYEELNSAYSTHLISNINIHGNEDDEIVPAIIFVVEFTKKYSSETLDAIRIHLFEKYQGLVHQVQVLTPETGIMIYTSGVHINYLCLGVYDFDHIFPI